MFQISRHSFSGLEKGVAGVLFAPEAGFGAKFLKNFRSGQREKSIKRATKKRAL
jgi:hypothetical protein